MSEENGQGVDAQGNWPGSDEGKTSTPVESGRQGWSDGGAAVEDMTVDDARAEIKSIEGDPSFAGDGKMDYWGRQNMLKRRDALYRILPNADEPYNFMAENLEKQGITEESLEADQEKFEDRDEKESRKKTMDTLITHFGGEEEAKKAVVQARGLLNRFAGPDDLVFLEDAGLANDPELIQKLAEISQIFERGGKK